MSILSSFAKAAARAAGIGALAGAVLAQSPDAGAKLTPPVVAVVDIEKAMSQYPRFVKMRNELEERDRRNGERVAELEKQLDELRASLGVVQSADEVAETEFKLQLGLQQRDFLRKSSRDRLQLEHRRNLLLCYDDLEVVIAKVAKQRGASLVLGLQSQMPATGPIEKMSAREVQERVVIFDRRQVWFHGAELDITGDVIKLLQILPAEKPAEKPADAQPGGAPAPKPQGGGE